MTEIRFHGHDVRRGLRLFTTGFFLLVSTLVALGMSRPAPGHAARNPLAFFALIALCVVAVVASSYLRSRVRVRIDRESGTIEGAYVPTTHILIRYFGMFLLDRVSHPLAGLTDVRAQREPDGSRYGVVLDYPGAHILLVPKYWYGQQEVESFAMRIRQALAA